MIKITIGTLSLSLCLMASAQGASICSSDNIARARQKTASFGSSNELFRATGAQTKLHVFGEVHYYTNTDLLGRLIREISTSLPGQRKCVFLEMPKDGLAHYEQMIRSYLQKPDLDPIFRKRLEFMAPYYPTIVGFANSVGFNIHEVDHPGHLADDKTEDERNLAMAENSARLLSNGTCDSAVFFVGKAHISPLENRPSVIELMKQAGLDPITYNVADSAETSDARMASWKGLECDPKNELPDAFSNSVLEENTVLFPNLPSQRKSLWNDFDYSISR